MQAYDVYICIVRTRNATLRRIQKFNKNKHYLQYTGKYAHFQAKQIIYKSNKALNKQTEQLKANIKKHQTSTVEHWRSEANIINIPIMAKAVNFQ